jgi:2-methylcitrate dehydratase PrpD
MMSAPASTVAQRIAAFSSSLTWESLPAEVKEKSKVTLLHNLGVALAGIPLVAAPLRYARALEENGTTASARLLAGGIGVTPDTAALVNGALMHARAQDDVYFPGLTHAGAVMTPAVLAVAESIDAPGREVLTALVAGVEAAAALSQDYGVAASNRGFRPTGAFGVFASTVAVARLLKLDAERTVNAIGIASNAAGGCQQPWVASSQEWQLHVGMGARNGILAAKLAAAGVEGAPDAIEGIVGFYRCFTGSAEGAESVATDLGRTWRIKDVTYKPFPVCAILQGPVTGAIALAKKHDLQPGDIAAVRLHLNPTEAAIHGTDSRGPFADTGATLMSAQFCLSVALSKRTVQGRDLQRYEDPLLAKIIARSSVHADPSLGTRSFVLEVDRTDGTRLRHVEQTEGEPFNWTREETVASLRRIADELPFDGGDFDAFVQTVLDAERHSAREIVDACVRGSRNR